MRHEYKHVITYEDYLVISSRLRSIVQFDSHAGENGTYLVHSLYFDNLKDKVLREKIDGIDRREKFRIRYYNENTSYIMLEKKSKIHELCDKQSVQLKKEQVEAICSGDIEFLLHSEDKLCQELYAKMRYQLLKPRCIVEYERIPFVYKPGNVRITFDSNVRTGLYHDKFFDGNITTVPTEPGTIILEVKYDAFLPEIIEKAVRVPNRRASAFSKYAVCRKYG